MSQAENAALDAAEQAGHDAHAAGLPWTPDAQTARRLAAGVVSTRDVLTVYRLGWLRRHYQPAQRALRLARRCQSPGKATRRAVWRALASIPHSERRAVREALPLSFWESGA